MPSDSPSRPWWLAAVVIGIGAVCIWGASSLPAGSRYAGMGPGTVPALVGGALVVLGLLLGISIARGEKFEAQDAENADADATMNPRAFLLALAAACLPALAVRTFGLPLTAAACFVLVARAFGSRALPTDIVVGMLLGIVSWVFFEQLGLQLGDFLPLAGF